MIIYNMVMWVLRCRPVLYSTPSMLSFAADLYTDICKNPPKIIDTCSFPAELKSPSNAVLLALLPPRPEDPSGQLTFHVITIDHHLSIAHTSFRGNMSNIECAPQQYEYPCPNRSSVLPSTEPRP